MPEKLVKTAARADSGEFSQVIEHTAATILAERKVGRIEGGSVNGGLVEFADVGRIAVVSDLHGDTQTLLRILDRLDFEKFLSDKKNKLIFLGDYVDRGSDSVGVLFSVCRLKGKYPDSVILMRGNHEAPAEFPFLPQNLPYEMQDRFGANAKTLYRRVMYLFRLMTLTTVVKDRLLLVHGGLPTETFDPLMISEAQETQVQNRIMEELLWNDPQPTKGWSPSHRGIGRYFGPDITQRWLKLTNARVVVRGHEPCDGFKVDHQGGVLTLFSSREAYPAFGVAYLLVDADKLVKVENGNDLVEYAVKL